MGYEFRGVKKRIPLLLSVQHEYAKYVADDIIRRGIPQEDVRVTPYGVRVMTDDLDTVSSCRMYDRLYLTVPIKRGECLSEENTGETIANSMLRRILDSYIKGERPVPCRIRVELPGSPKKGRKAEKARDEISRLGTVFSEAITDALSDTIVLDPTDYECEIYLTGRPDGSFGMYLWIASMGDKRFDYRSVVSSTSMSAVRAATMVGMVKKYLIEGNTVIDPFCGTGTLLIERLKAGGVDNAFGTDISAQMISGARENASNAASKIHFIQRDFFEFTYDGVIDEVITELPDLYHREVRDKKNFIRSFLDKCLEITAEGAVFCILTGDPDILSVMVDRSKSLEIAEHFAFGGKREVFVLRRL